MSERTQQRGGGDIGKVPQYGILPIAWGHVLGSMGTEEERG